jgi:hypothetical protein
MEPYLDKIDSKAHRKALCQLRTSSHQLNIEALRGKIVEPAQRKCDVCTLHKTEDETHFLLECSLYGNIHGYLNKTIMTDNPNLIKLSRSDYFIWLMTNEDKQICKQLGKFVWNSFDKRKRYLTQSNIKTQGTTQESCVATNTQRPGT